MTFTFSAEIVPLDYERNALVADSPIYIVALPLPDICLEIRQQVLK